MWQGARTILSPKIIYKFDNGTAIWNYPQNKQKSAAYCQSYLYSEKGLNNASIAHWLMDGIYCIMVISITEQVQYYNHVMTPCNSTALPTTYCISFTLFFANDKKCWHWKGLCWTQLTSHRHEALWTNYFDFSDNSVLRAVKSVSYQFSNDWQCTTYNSQHLIVMRWQSQFLILWSFHIIWLACRWNVAQTGNIGSITLIHLVKANNKSWMTKQCIQRQTMMQ